MIHAAVRMVDLDPDLFRHVNDVLARRDRALRRAITILHDQGRVVDAVHSAEGRIAPPVERVDDPAATADAVAAAHDVEHVTVVDRSALDDLSAQLVELGRSCSNQGELLWRAREAWNHHPGVAQSPRPTASQWPAAAAALAAVPDGAWVELVATRDDAPPWRIAGRVDAGLLVEITSRPVDPGAVAIRLEAPLASFDRVLESPEPMRTLHQEVGWPS